MLAALAVALARRRAPRTDALRAGVVLWGIWLVVNLGVLDSGSLIQPYYAAVLSPAVAALCGLGFGEAWRAERTKRRVRVVVLAAVAGSSGYASWLLSTGSGVPVWLEPTLIAVGVISVAGLAVSLLGSAGSRLAQSRWAGSWLGGGALVGAAVAMLVAPSAASASLVIGELGAFDTPFQPAAVTSLTQASQRRYLVSARATIPYLERYNRGAHYLLAAETSGLAAPYIFVSGREVLPIGGVTGSSPSPTLAQLEADVASGKLVWVVTPTIPDPRIAWVRAHCRNVEPKAALLGAYYCGS